MTPCTLLSEAITTLRLNAVRSALTSIGIMIGVAGVIVLGAAGSGANARIQQLIKASGADALVVAAVKVANAGERRVVVLLTDDDAKAIADKVPDIRSVSREVDSNVTLVAGNASWTTQYWGVDASYADVYDVKISDGRFFDESEVREGARVLVLGATTAEKLFGDEPAVGATVRMGTVPMRVIGVRARRGFVGGQDRDNHVIVPITTARSRLPKAQAADPRALDFIDTKVHPGADRKAVKEAILALLCERKHILDTYEDKLEVRDPTQYVELMNTTHASLSWLLTAATMISLVVGGVGIMNIMLVSVTERTHEIGLRKAIGARERDILAQFLTEAIMLCAAAGLIGSALGIAGGAVIARASGWPLIITPQSVALALAASVGVGVAFGYLPAHRAAALDPIEALRRE